MADSITGVNVWLAIWKTFKSIESFAIDDIEAFDLCLSDFGIMEALLHKGALPVNTIGRIVMLTSGSITPAIDRLEKKGLVKRENHPKDRRIRLVMLTSAEKRMITVAFKKHKETMEIVTKSVTDSLNRDLLKTLREIRKSVMG